MFTLIKNGQVYSPDALGALDVLIAGETIVAMAPGLSAAGLPAPCEVIDVAGKVVAPGLVDQHIHLIGGGGEGGLGTRTPPASFGKLLRAGISTVVGVLGTDGSTRSPRDLYAKVMGFRQEGLSAYLYTGSYELPTVTITGTVRSDLIFIEPVLGAKIALGDHRGSFPNFEEMLRTASDVRMGGMLSGKRGVLHIHLGALAGSFEMIEAVVARGIPRQHFTPTHVARTEALLAEAIAFGRAGGLIDITSGGGSAVSACEAVRLALEAGVAPDRITISSDGNGSMPVFDAQGKMVAIAAAAVDSNLRLLPQLVDAGVALPQALALTTRNPARGLGIAKGELQVGGAADLLVLDDSMEVHTLIARGRVMVGAGEQRVRGNFE